MEMLHRVNFSFLLSYICLGGVFGVHRLKAQAVYPAVTDVLVFCLAFRYHRKRLNQIGGFYAEEEEKRLLK